MLTPEEVYEITRKAVQYAYPAKKTEPTTQVYGPDADMDSLNMVDAIIEIERELSRRDVTVQIAVGDLGDTVTVKDLADHVWELASK